LLNGQVARVFEAFFPKDDSAAPMGTAAIPLVCQEAVLVYLEATGQNPSPAVARRLDAATVRDFMEYSDVLRRRAAGYPVNTGDKFETRYFHYYTSLSSQRRTWANTVDSAH
jgi:hypothetical protein